MPAALFQSLLEAVAANPGCQSATIGVFDGVHLGHQSLIAAAAQDGLRPLVVTFFPHPAATLQPALAPRLITTLPRRLELLSAAGAHAIVVQRFDDEFARTPASDFEQLLFDALRLRRVVVGGDFAYGRGRSGGVDSLQRAALRAGAQVHIAPPIAVRGARISSSRIREYVLEGRMSAAQAMLGRTFDLDGEVVKGAGRGRTLGFPTANLATTNELLPPTGVYAITATSGDGEVSARGVANVGVRPTFAAGFSIEAHLLDFHRDLYGKVLRIAFVERLRDEMKFPSPAHLTTQIVNDIEAARSVFKRFDVPQSGD